MGTGSFPVVKRPGRGVDHPPPSSAEVKVRVVIPLLPLWAFMACSRVNCTFTVQALKGYVKIRQLCKRANKNRLIINNFQSVFFKRNCRPTVIRMAPFKILVLDSAPGHPPNLLSVKIFKCCSFLLITASFLQLMVLAAVTSLLHHNQWKGIVGNLT
jgi:hypothetical protein